MSSTSSSALGAAVVALLASACVERGAPEPPRLLHVSPVSTFNTAPTLLSVEGEHFYLRGVLTLAGPAGADSAFQLWVGDVALEEVRRLDSAHLEGRLPEGVAPGTYSLRLIDPWGREVALPEAVTVRGRRGAVLHAKASAPTVVQVGNTLEVMVEVTNEGDTAAEAVDVQAGPLTGSGSASLFQKSSPSPLAPGERVLHRLLLRTKGVGEVSFSLTASGIDGFWQRPVVGEPVTVGPVRVVSPPVLVGTVTAQPNPVAVGQALLISAEVANQGQGTVRDFLPTATMMGDAGLTQLTTPLPRDLTDAGIERFTFSFEANAAGEATVVVDGRGTSSATGLPVFLTLTSTPSVRVLRPPALSALVTTTPTGADVGEVFSLSVVVRNEGEEDAEQVALDVTTIGAGRVSPLSSPPAQTVPGSGSAVFLLAFEAAAPGPVRFDVSGLGVSAQGRQATRLGCKWSLVQIQSPRPFEGPDSQREIRGSQGLRFASDRR